MRIGVYKGEDEILVDFRVLGRYWGYSGVVIELGVFDKGFFLEFICLK